MRLQDDDYEKNTKPKSQSMVGILVSIHSVFMGKVGATFLKRSWGVSNKILIKKKKVVGQLKYKLIERNKNRNAFME